MQADSLSVRHVLRVIRARLAGGLPDAAADTLELVLAEILNNIVEHAYRDEGGQIEVLVCPVPGALLCRITDQGRAMPGDMLPHPDRPQPDLAVADLPEGGFGWRIVRDLVGDLHYRREAGSNTIRFRITLD
ncbi:ATP-binding protein [Frigidibacter sp.]|uniref:ATP-binding protein n=1 Tax=Frigidibacter sp. TaxID=2586418 RepID=UPI002735A9D4|nr:ATP-binding protein [Frigidibacter sp.]MDP3339459.1 ATP-binding protein [Frigidibacter sp.]